MTSSSQTLYTHSIKSTTYKIISLTGALILIFCSSLSQAAVIYDFYGICGNSCSSIAQGTLVLNDSYIPGTELSGGDYISWHFRSSAGSYALNSPYNSGENGMWGILPQHIGSANFFLDFGGENTYFETGYPRADLYNTPPGSWLNTGPEPAQCHIISCDHFNFVHADGAHHLWVRRITEPASIFLFFIGLAGLYFSKTNKLTLS